MAGVRSVLMKQSAVSGQHSDSAGSSVERRFGDPVEAAGGQQVFGISAVQLDVDLLRAKLAIDIHGAWRGQLISQAGFPRWVGAACEVKAFFVEVHVFAHADPLAIYLLHR